MSNEQKLPKFGERNISSESCLDMGDTRFGPARITRYYYALTLRDVGDIVADNASHITYEFEPNMAEREEFPELEGIAKVRLSTTHVNNFNSVEVDYGYAVFTEGVRRPNKHSDVFTFRAEAFEWIKAIQSHEPTAKAFFRDKAPYVGRMDEPKKPLRDTAYSDG